MKTRVLVSLMVGFATVYSGGAMAAETVLFNDAVVEIGKTLPDPLDLWVSPEDLPKVTGFVLKEEGACFEDVCIPIRQDEDSEKFVTRAGEKWVNASALTKVLQQSVVVDRDSSVWSFGEVPAVRSSATAMGMAPDFAIEDREGNLVRLSDFRGKKVLIATWASW